MVSRCRTTGRVELGRLLTGPVEDGRPALGAVKGVVKILVNWDALPGAAWSGSGCIPPTLLGPFPP